MNEVITVWHKLNPQTGEYEFNHICMGFDGSQAPIPIGDFQEKSWKGAKWKSVEGTLDRGSVEETKNKVS